MSKLTKGLVAGAVVASSALAIHPLLASASEQAQPRTRSVASVVCSKAAPTSLQGFRDLWETVPDNQWGGGDLGISIKLPDGRVVWVYADSWRPGALDGVNFVHSVALVQDKGCLHASHAGAQLLPNDDGFHIYWPTNLYIQSTTGRLVVRGRSIRLTGTGPWDFADNGFSKNFYFDVTPQGDLTPVATGVKMFTAAPTNLGFYTADGVSTTSPDPDHFYYSLKRHPEQKLADGKVLYTLAQNWGPNAPGADAYGFHHDPTWKSQNAPIWLEKTS